MLYPPLGWTPIYAGIFSPAGSSWPFDYGTIFTAAFADEVEPQTALQLCQQDNAPDDLVGRMRETVQLAPAQREALQQLTGAIAHAKGYLRASCPREIPESPLARLQLMERQIDTVLMALEIVRVPLQQFEGALSAPQRARLSAAFAGRRVAECPTAASDRERPIAAIGQAVQPSDAQRQALSELEAASVRAARGLEANCQAVLPATPLARLEAFETRLDATWRAVQTMQVALARLYRELDDEQRRRFDALDVAALQPQG
jgi:hypothetical protein